MFTHVRGQTIDNIADEDDVDADFIPGTVGDTLDRILVPLRGDSMWRILGFVGVMLRESDATATVYHVADSEEESSRGELLVRSACDQLVEDRPIDAESTGVTSALSRPPTLSSMLPRSTTCSSSASRNPRRRNAFWAM